MSQVLQPIKPVTYPHPTATTTAHNPQASSTLISPSTLASSSRPKRAAALASQAATLASAKSTRKKSSHSSSSSKKSGSHPSIKATPTTTTTGSPPQQSKPEQSSYKEHLPKDSNSQRVMAALPRSKRARRGGGPDESIHNSAQIETGEMHDLHPNSMTSNAVNGNGSAMGGPNGGASRSSIMTGIDTALTNGYSHHHITDTSMNGSMSHKNSQFQLPVSASSSISKIGNESNGSVREMINGLEREVFLIDSTSPPVQNYADRMTSSSIAKGKRKASPANSTATNLSANSAAAASKRRKKEELVAPPALTGSKAKTDQITTPRMQAYPPEYQAPKNQPFYRGAFDSDYAYQSPNGTRWTDSIENPYHPARWNLPVDDTEGHYIIREGNLVAGRYSIKSLLGQGTFGKVVRCKDTIKDREVAIKIIRSIQKYTDAAQIEIRVLKALREEDPANENKCIHLIDTFTYRNHVCIVSELLGQSVFDFLKDNSFSPFPSKNIWSFAKQLLRSVAFLHRLGLIHTDLKPENILLVSNDHTLVPLTKRANSRKKRVLRNSEIRLIDFGSATFNEEYHSQVVSTRHYRAPEIILQMGWSFPCDAWSIGCILIEFYTGEALFQTHDNLEHLAMMEAVLGIMPDDFRRKAETYRPAYFRNGGKLDFPNASTNKQSRKFVKAMHTIDELINSGPAYTKHDQRFRHLLKRLLTFDPHQRIKVDQALSHPYFDLLESEIPS
ncbi:hypothetical protein CBS101457_005948 [Exobasidium rhododendri]|nr:hypothetical protein CBS101457_005948 [Exobasidium rhododendri]